MCEAREEDGFSDGDVLIFPDLIKYKGLEESKVDSFVNNAMVSDETGGAVPNEARRNGEDKRFCWWRRKNFERVKYVLRLMICINKWYSLVVRRSLWSNQVACSKLHAYVLLILFLVCLG